MKNLTAKKFILNPHNPVGSWSTNDSRYRFYAHKSLAELELICKKINKEWPTENGQSINMNAYPEMGELVLERDRLSDSIRIFSAMAVEGYLNFYGVLRLGQNIYLENFERMPLVQKARSLILVCDDLEISKQHPLIQAAIKVSECRNSLVHPKAIEIPCSNSMAKDLELPVPQTARNAVKSMESFLWNF
ncbi:MAG TPA: hypothetical protein DIW64_01385 [Cellvibrio sp.]|nr:hypothetical protein [Cellvibrio sp.]